MFQSWQLRLTALAVMALVGLSIPLLRLMSQEGSRPSEAQEEPAKKESPELAAVRLASEKYVAAFNKGDVKAATAAWAADGEYHTPDGNTIKGRDNLEKAAAEFFKKNPKARLKVEIQSLRLLGRSTAMEEGLQTLTRDEGSEPEVTRYSAIYVREGETWLLAVVRENDVDPSELVSVKDLGWLVGQWQAKGEDRELAIKYEWSDDKVYLIGTFTIKDKGKIILTGTQRFARDPAAGVLRCWVFESGGGFGDSVWVQDGKRWVSEAVGVLPDGSETTAVNLLIPLGPDAFTYQSVNRTVAGVEVEDLSPVKVTRVKK